MLTIPAEAFKRSLSSALDRAIEGKRTLISRHGRAVAALIPLNDLHKLSAEEWSPADLESLLSRAAKEK
jgi:prevent-host-death family protein